MPRTDQRHLPFAASADELLAAELADMRRQISDLRGQVKFLFERLDLRINCLESTRRDVQRALSDRPQPRERPRAY